MTSTAKPFPGLTKEQRDRIFSRLVLTDAGCWVWTSPLSTMGYGYVKVNGSTYSPHRLLKELFDGPLASDQVCDHLCRNHACAAPSHIEAVSNAENILRGESPAAKNARQTHCLRGHEFTEENVYLIRPRSGGPFRACRICRRAANAISMRESRRRKREAQS